MTQKNMLTVTTQQNGNKIYSLNAFTGKNAEIIKMFFEFSQRERHKILKAACENKLSSIEGAEVVYNQIAMHSYNLFAPFLFIHNFHNFIAFLQQYKEELEQIGINSFLPKRTINAKKISQIEIDQNGICVEVKPKKEPTHRKAKGTRIYIKDIKYRSEYFNKHICRDINNLNDSTIVIRTAKGTAPIMFFNIVTDNDVNKTDIKGYEIDRLKTIYAQITGINYMDVRPVTYKKWKTYPIEKKIGTSITKVDDDFANKFFYEENKLFINLKK